MIYLLPAQFCLWYRAEYIMRLLKGIKSLSLQDSTEEHW